MSATTTPSVSRRSVEVCGGRLSIGFQVAGSGPPLLYLHPAAGMGHWDAFLTTLAERYTVYAPEVPGTTPGSPHAIHQVQDVWELVLAYEEAIRGLALEEKPVLIGQSFGGMLAAELAAAYPDLCSRLVLLAPIGLWREDAPLANWMDTPPEQLPALLFADPTGPAARGMFTMPDDPEMVIAIQSSMVWAMGCTGKFAWPIPERGLRRRLHRIVVPTLVLWGQEDRLNPVTYAADFGDLIKGSIVHVIPDAGHIPQVEATEETLAQVDVFLG
jgi:pimeloyl-ACP methyl ester carboxylesterase